jgi:xanthine/CO dehydrogenase XdhC/CoxF family maturation factor
MVGATIASGRAPGFPTQSAACRLPVFLWSSRGRVGGKRLIVAVDSPGGDRFVGLAVLTSHRGASVSSCSRALRRGTARVPRLMLRGETALSPKSALITGAAGFIGSHLAERCLELGWDVTALDAFTDYYDIAYKRANLAHAASHPKCTIVEGEILDLDLPRMLDGVTVVFHLAAQPGVRRSWEDFDVYTRANVTATHRLLEAARERSL